MKRADDGKWGDGGRGFHPVRSWHIFGFLFVVVLALGVSVTYRVVEENFGYGGDFASFNDEKCDLLVTAEGPFSSEDFAEYKDGLFFVSGGDLGPAFGAIRDRAMQEGKMWVVDTQTDSSQKLEKRLKEIPIDGLPPRSKIAFQPHGLYYSKKTNTLYAISHGGDNGGEKVFTFTPSTRLAKKGVNSVKLTFERAISTDEYAPLHGVFNDVVEGTKKGEFYMTQFLPGPLPKSGVPSTFGEHLTHATNYLSLFLAKRTLVHRCTFDPKKKSEKNEDVVCEVAASGFSLANGITVNDERDTYWVVDGRRVHELKREENGQLTKVDVISMPHMGDNIDWNRENGDLWVGALPNPLKAFANMGTGKPSEGSLHVIHQSNGKMSSSEDLIFHKGGQLGSVSAGAVHKSNILLGSPFHNGVLVCAI